MPDPQWAIYRYNTEETPRVVIDTESEMGPAIHVWGNVDVLIGQPCLTAECNNDPKEFGGLDGYCASCVSEQYDEGDDPEPFEDGPLKGEFVKHDSFRGVGLVVVADDGEQCCTVVMVGDDGRHVVDRLSVVMIDREDLCGECGQLGCTHDGLDRG